MSFLGLESKRIVLFGVSNRKSVAFRASRVLEEAGAEVWWGVHTEERRTELKRHLDPDRLVVCDFEAAEGAEGSPEHAASQVPGPVHGLVHAVAFANYSRGAQPFQHTVREDFLQAVDVSCYSLVRLARAFQGQLASDGSVVTVSISTTRMAAENYGYMAPVKAALESAVVFLAKSFSTFGEVRFNAVAPSLLKTRSAAGIPGYAESYMFAEKATFRKRGVTVDEVAHTAAFLLSPRSSGINGQTLVVDAGMGSNYFDQELVQAALRGLS